MSKPSAKAFTTPLVPPLAFPEVPDDKHAAANLWEKVYWEATRHATGRRLILDLSSFGHFNPEYFLERWSETILESDSLRDDAWGWALETLEREQENCLGRPPNPEEMLKRSQCFDFLARFKGWAEARLAYHRTALQLTFYEADKIARKEPVASNVERLKARFADWRDVRLRERRELFENDRAIKKSLRALKDDAVVRKDEMADLMFRRWIEGRSADARVITGEAIEWLCWLRLVSPLSRKWQLHEIGLAVRKLFVGRDYVRAAKKWLANPPRRQTYAEVDEGDEFSERVVKRGFSQEFLEWKADWLSKRLEDTKDFREPLLTRFLSYC